MSFVFLYCRDSTWCQVPGSKYEVPGTKYPITSTSMATRPPKHVLITTCGLLVVAPSSGRNREGLLHNLQRSKYMRHMCVSRRYAKTEGNTHNPPVTLGNKAVRHIDDTSFLSYSLSPSPFVLCCLVGLDCKLPTRAAHAWSCRSRFFNSWEPFSANPRKLMVSHR